MTKTRVNRVIDWTPDGRYVIFGKGYNSIQKPMVELWRISADGGEPQRLGIAMDQIAGLRVHPDGRRIAFTAGQTKSEVWVMENFLPAAQTRKTSVSRR